MMQERWIDYEERFDAVLSHVYDHLDEPLDLIRLSEVAGLSPRHWHRIFESAFGESVSSLVKRIRLQRATALLSASTTSIREIATACGYPNQSSFTRAFHTATGLTPTGYREHGGHVEFRIARTQGDPDAFSVELRDTPPIECVAVRHRGSYLEIDRAFNDLRIWLAAAGHNLTDHEMYGVFLSDPTRTADDDLESIACVTRPTELVDTPKPLSVDAAQVEAFTIRAGPYAVLTHVGSYADMPDKYAWLFGCWVPHAGHPLSEDPIVEHYLTSPGESSPTAQSTQMWLPLEPLQAVGPGSRG